MQLKVSVIIDNELTVEAMVALFVGKYAPVHLFRSNQPLPFTTKNTRSDNNNNNTNIINTASQVHSPMAHHLHVISANVSNTYCTSPVRGQPAHSCTAPHTAFSPRINYSRCPPPPLQPALTVNLPNQPAQNLNPTSTCI
tara:strand:- start:515 stop:934 length:420 start_codon:yes stop_codon:yes gene_type:complete